MNPLCECCDNEVEWGPRHICQMCLRCYGEVCCGSVVDDGCCVYCVEESTEEQEDE